MFMRSVALVATLFLFGFVGPLRAADKEAIDFAVQKGVAYLKAQIGRDPNGGHGQTGPISLAGLALLECGVDADDPAVAWAAKNIRAAGPGITQTYSIALAILFLDRLGAAGDVPLIESLTVRLLAGQRGSGMWSYDCPPIGDAEVRRLVDATAQARAGERDVPKDRGKIPRGPRELPDDVQKQIDAINRAGFGPAVPGQGVIGGMMPDVGGGDNSNTQFAILGLWVGRRQGLPVAQALARADAHFRATQAATGGWGYVGAPAMFPGGGGGGDGTPAMTCAGLLGLALGFGVNKEAADKKDDKKDPKNKPAPPDLGKDMAVKRGLLALSTAIGNPVGNGIGIPALDAETNGRGYYFLWSLERVAVAYNLDTIGNKDWYGWGSEIILRNQGRDGGWIGEYGGGGVDTSFALLFLRRANLARDLSATLKGVLKDPTKFELGAGGVGGAAFLEKVGLKPAFDNARPGKRTDGAAGPRKRKAEGEAAKLSEELVKAPANKQKQVLEKLRDTSGGDCTEALADAIYKLEGEQRKAARDALEDRMLRMTSKTLTDKMKDTDPEIRRAAVLATARKDPLDKALLPLMVELLDDEEVFVGRAARAALKAVSKVDFGPSLSADKAERARSLARWKDWAAKQQR